MRPTVCCALLVLFLASCGKGTPSADKSKAAAKSDDPVATFQVKVAQCSVAFEAQRETVTKGQQAWIRSRVEPGPVKYDVRKTDSLVNPVIAVLNVEYNEVVATESSEAAVRALPASAGLVSSYEWSVTYALEAGEWKPSKARVKSSLTRFNGSPPPTRAPVDIEAPVSDFLASMPAQCG